MDNAYIESFNDRLRDALLDAEIFYTLLEANAPVTSWRGEYTEIGPDGSVGCRPPVPQAGELIPAFAPAGSAPLDKLEKWTRHVGWSYSLAG